MKLSLFLAIITLLSSTFALRLFNNQKAVNTKTSDINLTPEIKKNGRNKNSRPASKIGKSIDMKRYLVGAFGLLTGSIVSINAMDFNAMAEAATGPSYPIIGSDSIMMKKAHGTSDQPVQSKLRWNVDVPLADRISNYNRMWAEFAGYWTRETTFLAEVDPTKTTDFYDSVTGKPLFKAPVGRSFDEWKQESMVHGWPSFRDSEVNWDNVRALRDGEMVSLTGTHLGHNLPDRKGNRYCINLVSVAGFPSGQVDFR